MADALTSSEGLPRFGGAPSRAPVAGVRDVLIVTTEGEFEDDEYQDHPPIGLYSPAVSLAEDLRIDHLVSDEAELVMNACTPRGHHFVPVRQFGQRYAFIRDIEASEFERQHSAWDPGNRLLEAVILSRLIVDNNASTLYAARVVDFEDGEKQVLYQFPSESDHVFAFRSESRNWLDESEGHALGRLLAAYWADRDRPQKVKNAMWLSEYSRYTRWLDQALPLIVTALEVLVQSGRSHVTRQFVERVPRLAAEVGVEDVSKSMCRKAYEDRSSGVHVGRLPARDGVPQDAALRRVTKLRQLLSVVERRCIEDPDFQAYFRDPESIRAAWPVVTTSWWGLRRQSF